MFVNVFLDSKKIYILLIVQLDIHCHRVITEVDYIYRQVFKIELHLSLEPFKSRLKCTFFYFGLLYIHIKIYFLETQPLMRLPSAFFR